MKMAEKRPLDDTELDALFSAARVSAAEPDGALMARIFADAEAEMPVALPVGAARPGLLARAVAAVGGWPAAAGLAAAAVTGLVIGLGSAGTLSDLSEGYLVADADYQLEDLLPSYGGLLGDG